MLLVSSTSVAEEAEQQTDTEQTEMDGDADALELARQRAIKRKKQQINGYQAYTVAGQEIDGTYLEEVTGDKHGVVVFFHDNNQQLEAPAVVTPLRQRLPNYGWSTISFSMDYPEQETFFLSTSLENSSSTAEASTPEEEQKKVVMADGEDNPGTEDADTDIQSEALPPVSNEERVQAILSFIQAIDYPRIIFIGVGAGAEIAANIMAPLDTSIEALILIDAEDFNSHEEFEKIYKPIIDIYPEQTTAEVKSGLLKRKKITKLEPKSNYLSRVVVGANKGFYGFESRLTKIIRSILHKQFLAEQD